MEKYSISRLKQYDTCKLAYYLKYKMKIRKPYEAHPSAVFGNLVHWAAENDIYDLDIIRERAKTPEFAKIKKSDLGVELKRNIEAVREYKELDNNSFPTRQEEQWLNWSGDKINFCGKVDRILYNDTTCKIVDYKTNSKVATTSDDYIPQLKFYNLLLLLSNSVEGRNVITELFYTRHNVTIMKKFTRIEIKQFAAEIKKKIVEIESNTSWLPCASYGNCMFCDFKNDKKLCQASKIR